MTKITSLKDLQNMPVMVRVISTKSNDEEQQNMVGGEFEVRITFSHYNNKRHVYTKDKSDYFLFNESELQVLTPVKYNGVTIGIGDKINGKEVYGFHWYDGTWKLNCVQEGDLQGDCYNRSKRDITSHIPLHTPTPKMSDEEMIAELTKRGRLKEGVILE